MLQRYLKRSKTIMCAAILLAASTIVFSGCVQKEPADKGASTEQTAVATGAEAQTVEQNTELLSTDCVKCHESQPADISSDGGKHKSEISCRDCHVEHPPWGEDTIPECSNCHDSGDRDHFSLENCLGCHQNPHTPLNLSIADSEESTTGCLTCHGEKGEEFKSFPSMHSEQNCTLCHPARHKVINKCFTCHEGHAETMVYEDCLKCHKPHSPLNITYADDTPSVLCGACHGEIYESLTSNPSKHQQFNCAFCHESKHPTVPECRDCHDAPHDDAMLAKFPDCLKCHEDPHDLVY